MKLKKILNILNISLLPGLAACSSVPILDQAAKAEESSVLVYYNEGHVDLSYTLKTNQTTGYSVVNTHINFSLYFNVDFNAKSIELDGFYKSYTIDFIRFNPFNEDIHSYSNAVNDGYYIPVNLYLNKDNSSIYWETEFDGDANGFVNDSANYYVGAYDSLSYSPYFEYAGGIDTAFTNLIGNASCLSASAGKYYYLYDYDYLTYLINQYNEIKSDILTNPNNFGLYTQSQLEEYKNIGFNEGANSTLENNGFIILMTTIFSAPVSMFRQAFNFEIFGINIANIVALLLTIGLVILVVSIFKGKNGS